jgi:voltage-gated potassium channel
MRVIVRELVVVTAMIAAYYLAPLQQVQDPRTLVIILSGMFIVIVLAAWQVGSILRSARPIVTGVQALGTSIPLYLLVFAVAYYLMSTIVPGSFTETMGRTDALYFTMTVFTTVGFGDITPVSEAARITVMVQMVGNLLVLGVLLRLVTRAVQVSRARRGTRDREGFAADDADDDL